MIMSNLSSGRHSRKQSNVRSADARCLSRNQNACASTSVQSMQIRVLHQTIQDKTNTQGFGKSYIGFANKLASKRLSAVYQYVRCTFCKTKCRANVNLHFHFYIETQTLHRRNANFVSQQQKRFHVITQTLRRRNEFSIKNNDKIEWNYLKSMSCIRQKKKSSKK